MCVPCHPNLEEGSSDCMVHHHYLLLVTHHRCPLPRCHLFLPLYGLVSSVHFP